VRLPPRDKQNLYHSLAQLVRSGVDLPGALAKLQTATRGRKRSLLRGLHSALRDGHTIREAFAGQPLISTLEAQVVAAAATGGRLDYGFEQLAQYYGAAADAADTLRKRLAYPVYVLHVSVLALGIPKLFTADAGVFLKETISTLGSIYAVAALVWILWVLLRDAGATGAVADQLLRALPLVGKTRRHFAVARFCMIYELQLGAGINVLDALDTAGKASRSGWIRRTVEGILPKVRAGSQVGPLLAASGALPEDVTRGIIVGEDTGRLDHELQRLAATAQAEGLSSLKTASFWIYQMLYLGILLSVAYRIVQSFQQNLSQSLKLLDF
jgi:type II secretory pathway component PulF